MVVMTIPELISLIISFLDHNNRINCFCINSTWRDLALAHVFSWVLGDDSEPLLYQRRLGRLLDQPLAQEALARNSRHVRNLHIEQTDILLPLLANASSCTNLVTLQCNLISGIPQQLAMLHQLIRKNPNLASLKVYDVSNIIDFEELVRALQTGSALTEFYLGYDQLPGSIVTSNGLASLIRGLAFPRFRLKSLSLDVVIVDPPKQGWSLFETDREDDTPRFSDLEDFIFIDKGHHSRLTAEVFYLPVLREAPELECLFIPEMSDSAIAAATTAITAQTPPLSHVTFGSLRSHPSFVDIVKASRRTLHTLHASQDPPSFCEPTIRALLPVNDADLCIKMNMQEIRFALEETPTASALIQRVLTSLPNLECFMQDYAKKTALWRTARLQIRDMVATPWVSHRLVKLKLCLGCRTAEDNVKETSEERRAKIRGVYKQLGALTRMKGLNLGCDVLGGPSEVELDFSLETGLEAMGPCLKELKLLDIFDVAGKRFSEVECNWLDDFSARKAMFVHF
ncbi:hypothetical protein MVEG_09278 [Podila verticillata NRRL 6337]|nr:hypothetical protein MVEG_09278 [Podila verticillata NRRL 6337]